MPTVGLLPLCELSGLGVCPNVNGAIFVPGGGALVVAFVGAGAGPMDLLVDWPMGKAKAGPWAALLAGVDAGLVTKPGAGPRAVALAKELVGAVAGALAVVLAGGTGAVLEVEALVLPGV